ncbi:hypothetical protein Bbelb_240160 [Branchiostoma belcheri]|nr:hypothetical protein Bbelb_240160 [Branchiostoma belcheri]
MRPLPASGAYERPFSYDGVKISSREYNSALINGRGRFRNNRAPLSTFTVPTGGSVNFRIIHVGPDYPFRFSVDQHELTVTASDGYDMAPRSVQSVILYPGESYDIRINGSADPDLYWIRAKTLRVGHCTKCYPYNEANVVPDDAIEEVRAVLRYQGVTANSDPNTSKRNCSEENPCYVFNCPFAGYPEHLNTFCININKAEAPVSSPEGEKSKVTDNDDEHSLITEASDDSAAVIVPCDKEQCLRSGCRCTHIIDIPYNKTIQLVMYNTFAPASQTHHSVHIHGHAFHVLAMGYPSYNKTTGRYVQPNTDVKCKNELCTDATWRDEPPLLNLMNPPLKDTVLVPANGYTVVRFSFFFQPFQTLKADILSQTSVTMVTGAVADTLWSDNPGHWFLHCHNDQHMNEGMALVLQEAADRHPAPPRGFPRCGDFTWSSEEYQRALEDNDIQTTALDTKVLILSTVVGVLAIVIILAVAGYCILKMKKKDASSLTVVADVSIGTNAFIIDCCSRVNQAVVFGLDTFFDDFWDHVYSGQHAACGARLRKVIGQTPKAIMKHLETLQERCLINVGHNLESYPPDLLSRLPGTLVAGVVPHLCQHHLNNCHDDIVQTGQRRLSSPRMLVWKTDLTGDSGTYSGTSTDYCGISHVHTNHRRKTTELLNLSKATTQRTVENRPPGTETLLLTPSCSTWCLRAAQDLMLYGPHVHRLILYDSRVFNYILQHQHLHRCLHEHVEHLELRWFRGLPGVGTFLRRCLASPVSKLEKLTMYGVPGGTDKSALQLLSLCAGSQTHANTLCPHCHNPRPSLNDSNVPVQDCSRDDNCDVKQSGNMKKTLRPHSDHLTILPPQQNTLALHSDDTHQDNNDEQDQTSRSPRGTDTSHSVDESVWDTKDSDSEDLYDIAVGAGCSTHEDTRVEVNCLEEELPLLPNCTCETTCLPGQNSDTDGIPDDERLPLVMPSSIRHHSTVREVILHDVLTSPGLIRNFCGLLKTWYSLERISISGGSYDSLPKDEVMNSLLECQRKGGKLTHLFLENELLSHWTFPNILLSLLQAKQSRVAGNSCDLDSHICSS